MKPEEIVKRLRELPAKGHIGGSFAGDCNAAADLIERQAEALKAGIHLYAADEELSEEVTQLRSALEEAEKALEPFAKAPPNGEYGGPMVYASVFYEDETIARAGKFYRIDASPFRKAAEALATIRAARGEKE